MHDKARWLSGVTAGLLFWSGCGAEERAQQTVSVPARAPMSPDLTVGTSTGRPAERAPSDKAPAEETAPALQRKIIYNAQVDLVVESVSSIEAELAELVKANGGYVSKTQVNTSVPQGRTATWTLRIPVDRFDTVMRAIERLGELTRNHVDSQDVTQEFYDLEARIANKQQEEKRLLKHLADSTGKLEDILAVEREISRVRGEIEQGQGRLRFLSSQTALSTITVAAMEVKNYTPPVSPTFGTLIGRTFHDSLETLTSFGKALVLIVVALAPWIPVIAAMALPAALLARRLRVRGRARTA